MGHGAEPIQLISTSNNKPDSICLQETWLGTGPDNKQSLTLSKYQTTLATLQLKKTALEVD